MSFLKFPIKIIVLYVCQKVVSFLSYSYFRVILNMEHSTFEELPSVVIDVVCSYLHPFDIARLEQTSRNILAAIQELNLWKKVAVTLIRKHSDVLGVQDILKYMKIHDVTSPKFYKIIIGLTVHTVKIVDDFGGSMHDKDSIEYISIARENEVLRKRDEENSESDESLDYDECLDDGESLDEVKKLELWKSDLMKLELMKLGWMKLE